VKVARYRYQNRCGIGRVREDVLVPAGDPVPLSAVELLPPILPGAKIIGVGRNYAEHAAESGDTPPDEPLIFAKLSNSLAAAGQAIVLPDISDEVDFEAELGVVIGRRTSRITPAEARSHVFGYTCVNDVPPVISSSVMVNGPAASPSTHSVRWVRGS
jgi:2-keto-4-pentenoate hydratase/2-oxohepta-3-ene-1,7-dioic acid hydratase in catechol pathway